MQGRSLGVSFRIQESAGAFNPEIVDSMLKGGLHQSCAVYIIREAVPSRVCKKVAANFATYIKQTGSTRQHDGYVNVAQIGATQFDKTAADYMYSCEQSRAGLDQLFAGLSSEEVDLLTYEDSLQKFFRRKGMFFGPSSYCGKQANLCTARSWLDQGEFALSPHEDIAQLALAQADAFEIGNVTQVIASNTCILNGRGGELIIWDVAPSDEDRRELNLINTGYPYPVSVLSSYPSFSLTIREGDIYFIDANLVHAVTTLTDGYRITLGRFMGFSRSDRIVYWT